MQKRELVGAIKEDVVGCTGSYHIQLPSGGIKLFLILMFKNYLVEGFHTLDGHVIFLGLSYIY